MYLHQQLIDNLLLLTQKKLINLQSDYVYSIFSDNHLVLYEWKKYTENPNKVRLLRYQYNCYIKSLSLYVDVTLDYILGPIRNNINPSIDCKYTGKLFCITLDFGNRIFDISNYGDQIETYSTKIYYKWSKKWYMYNAERYCNIRPIKTW